MNSEGAKYRIILSFFCVIPSSFFNINLFCFLFFNNHNITSPQSTRPLVFTHHNIMVLLSAKISTSLVLIEPFCFIWTYPNVFEAMQFWLQATSLVRCLTLFLRERLLTPSHFLPLKPSICLLGLLDVFVMFIIVDPILTNFILAQQGCLPWLFMDSKGKLMNWLIFISSWGEVFKEFILYEVVPLC